MAGTLGDMKQRVARELSRADIGTQIADAINDAILIYQKEKFRFNETVPNAPITFNTVVGQAYYDLNDNANIGSLFHIDYMLLQIGNARYYITPDDPKRLKIYNQVSTMLGQPLWYAMEGEQIILSPVPSNVWPIEIGLFRRYPAPASDAEVGNRWMIDGERLIRSRAKYEIATHVTRNPTMAQAMSPYPPVSGMMSVTQSGATYDAWKSMKSEVNRLVSLGRIRPMRF